MILSMKNLIGTVNKIGTINKADTTDLTINLILSRKDITIIVGINIIKIMKIPTEMIILIKKDRIQGIDNNHIFNSKQNIIIIKLVEGKWVVIIWMIPLFKITKEKKCIVSKFNKCISKINFNQENLNVPFPEKKAKVEVQKWKKEEIFKDISLSKLQEEK